MFLSVIRFMPTRQDLCLSAVENIPLKFATFWFNSLLLSMIWFNNLRLLILWLMARALRKQQSSFNVVIHNINSTKCMCSWNVFRMSLVPLLQELWIGCNFMLWVKENDATSTKYCTSCTTTFICNVLHHTSFLISTLSPSFSPLPWAVAKKFESAATSWLFCEISS